MKEFLLQLPDAAQAVFNDTSRRSQEESKNLQRV